MPQGGESFSCWRSQWLLNLCASGRQLLLKWNNTTSRVATLIAKLAQNVELTGWVPSWGRGGKWLIYSLCAHWQLSISWTANLAWAVVASRTDGGARTQLLHLLPVLSYILGRGKQFQQADEKEHISAPPPPVLQCYTHNFSFPTYFLKITASHYNEEGVAVFFLNKP